MTGFDSTLNLLQFGKQLVKWTRQVAKKPKINKKILVTWQIRQVFAG